MKILVAGFDTPGALERFTLPHLEEMGHEVTVFSIPKEFFDRWHFQHVPVINAVELVPLRMAFNRRLLRYAKAVQPDLILVFKGAEIFASTIKQMKSISSHPIIVNWNPDSPFDTATYNSNPQVIASIPLYDTYFIWDTDLIPRLKEAGSPRVEFLPFGYDPVVHHPVEQDDPFLKNFRCEVCFVGAYTPQRAELLSPLTHFDLGIWGPLWKEKLPENSPLRMALRADYIYGDDLCRAFSAGKIILNFIRPQNGDSHNMRTFEVPAAGGFMLATRTRQQREWLPEGETADYFSSLDEMVSKVEYYLSHEEERQTVAQTGHRRIIEGKHTYRDRMKSMMEVIHTL